MTNLSVNINKIATLRNARGGDMPNVVQAAIHCQKFGADGITIHPRPDQRHITKQDVYDIKEVINTEFNIEGYPSKEFIKMVLDVKPEQVTLVPDAVDVITSNDGWNTVENKNFLAGLNVYKGYITYKGVSDAFNLKYTPAADLLDKN